MESPSLPLCEMMEERNRTLLEVAKTISAHRNLDELFHDLAQRLPRVVPLNVVALGLHDFVRHILQLYTIQTNVPGDLVGGHEESIDTPLGWVWRTQQPLLISDLTKEERWPAVVQRMTKDGINSLCYLPLSTAVHSLGGIGFSSLQKAAYNDADLEFLRQVSQLVAVAVGNILYHRDLTLDRERLRLLLEVSEAISAHRDLKMLFHDLRNRLPAVVPFEHIGLILHDPLQDVMRIHVISTEQTERPPDGLELTMEESISAWVLKNQQPVVMPHLDEETRFPKIVGMFRQMNVRSCCFLPLTTAMRRLGAIGFGSVNPYIFGSSEVEFLSQVARQVAVAVDDVLNHQAAQAAQKQLAHEHEQLRLLLEVNNAIVKHLELDDLLITISACLQQVIQHDGSSLFLCDKRTGEWRIHVLDCSTNESLVELGRNDSVTWSPSNVAIETGKPTVFSERDLLDKSLTSDVARWILRNGFKSICSVPLLSHNRSLGALNVGRRQDSGFSLGEIELLTQVVQQITLAVEKAVAFKQIAQLKDKLIEEKLYL